MSICWVLEIDEMNDLSGVEIDFVHNYIKYNCVHRPLR